MPEYESYSDVLAGTCPAGGDTIAGAGTSPPTLHLGSRADAGDVAKNEPVKAMTRATTNVSLRARSDPTNMVTFRTTLNEARGAATARRR